MFVAEMDHMKLDEAARSQEARNPDFRMIGGKRLIIKDPTRGSPQSPQSCFDVDNIKHVRASNRSALHSAICNTLTN